MRASLIVLLALMAIPAMAQRDPRHGTDPIIGPETYVNSANDTSAVFHPGAYSIVSFRASVLDSANIIFLFQQRTKGNTAWTSIAAAAGDTLLTTSATNYEIVLRNSTVDRIGGASREFRVIAIGAASGNGVTSPTYTCRSEFSK